MHPEQLRVQQAEAERDDALADGDPERPDHRPAVALLDVLPAEVAPQLALAEAFLDVAERAPERAAVRQRRKRCWV
ncbi:hypothetical protein L1857_22800 [Amycolatopsis thermalba]|uniref:Uncharacterized protein n=1 Tax=Amycolatopsis thermalba TaxID=944492 RepID=A0ABY4NZJ3_9PSEU|nr:hypothetical protein L1857_22800 [Amycolatopsis thermalba]